MFLLALRAYFSLLRFERYMHRQDFAGLHRTVQSRPQRPRVSNSKIVDRIVSAVDVACIWYWKEVLCLQRSAVTACLLKNHGVDAHIIIGAQSVPFRAHAWVEVGGCVVNDKPDVRKRYVVLDQC